MEGARRGKVSGSGPRWFSSFNPWRGVRPLQCGSDKRRERERKGKKSRREDAGEEGEGDGGTWHHVGQWMLGMDKLFFFFGSGLAGYSRIPEKLLVRCRLRGLQNSLARFFGRSTSMIEQRTQSEQTNSTMHVVSLNKIGEQKCLVKFKKWTPLCSS